MWREHIQKVWEVQRRNKDQQLYLLAYCDQEDTDASGTVLGADQVAGITGARY